MREQGRGDCLSIPDVQRTYTPSGGTNTGVLMQCFEFLPAHGVFVVVELSWLSCSVAVITAIAAIVIVLGCDLADPVTRCERSSYHGGKMVRGDAFYWRPEGLRNRLCALMDV